MKPAYAVTYADPPTIDIFARMTLASAWNKSAVERVIGLVASDDIGKIVAATLCPEGGLALVIELPREEAVKGLLVGHDFTSEMKPTRAKLHAICAHVEWGPVKRKQIGLLKVDLIQEVEMESFELLQEGGGCNPGTVLYFPKAPKFSKRLYKRRRESAKDEGVIWARLLDDCPKISNCKQAEKLFPNFDFKDNRKLERVQTSTPTHRETVADAQRAVSTWYEHRSRAVEVAELCPDVQIDATIRTSAYRGSSTAIMIE